MTLDIWTLMNLSGILHDVKNNKNLEERGQVILL